MAQVIAILNWQEFQHYKDRDPPWIKLYRDLLTAESWVLGTDASRLVQVASMLLAARYKNATPLKYDLFCKVASLDISQREFDAAVEHLRSTNFLEIQGEPEQRKQPASKPLASCTSETETETETEKSRGEKRRASAPPLDPASVEGLDPEAWRLWVEHRTAIKKPIRPHSLRDAAEELAKLGSQQLAEVKRARAGGWQGLHPEKAGVGPRLTKYEENMNRLAAWEPTERTPNPLLIEGKL